MTSGGDIYVRRPGDPAGPRPDNSDARRVEGGPSSLRDGADAFFDARVPKPPKILERVGAFLGNIAKALFPDFFGIFGRVRELPEEYSGFAYLAFDSGAQLFYNVKGERIILAGSLYDVSSFIHKLLADPERWSVGSVVDVVRKEGIPFGSRVIRIDPAILDRATGLYKLSISADREISFSSLHMRFHEVADSLMELGEYEIEETAHSSMIFDVVAAMQKALRGVRPRYAAEAETMLPINPAGVRFGPEDIGRIDAGVRLGPDGKITAVTLRIVEHELIAKRFGVPQLFENESLWIGRISGRAISWEIENSNPENVIGERQAEIFGRIATLFRADVSHTLKGSAGKDAGGEGGDGTPPADRGEGGAPITAADNPIQGASSEITAWEIETDDENALNSANCESEYFEETAFDVSFGLFADGFFPEPVF